MKNQSSRGARKWQDMTAACVLAISLPFAGLAYAVEDDYLKSLEVESEKIRDTEQVNKDAEMAEGEDTSFLDSQRNAFESYLKVKHRGTYAFYSKLPDNHRDEVFKAFVDGAPMKDIRTMVIDRKLNR